MPSQPAAEDSPPIGPGGGSHLPHLPAGGGLEGPGVETQRLIFQADRMARRTSLVVIDEVEEDGLIVTSVTWKVYR